jgi:hypothetical protein
MERLGLIVDAGTVKTPRFQHDPFRSQWWRVYRVPLLAKLAAANRGGAYPSTPGHPRGVLNPAYNVSSSLCLLLRSQGLISGPTMRGSFAPGSVQGAFAATGPP